MTLAPASQMAFPIRVGPASAIPRNSFVRVRGLPPMAALSHGHSIAPGAWAIPLDALGVLEVTVPAGAAGQTDISVSLVAVDGSVLAEARSTLTIASRPRAIGPPGAFGTLAAPQHLPAERARPPGLPPEVRERAMRLLQRGDEQLAQGLIAPARLLYERAADLGLAQGAMALAATYDAAELGAPHLRTVSPDPKEARRWYERARQLGAAEADQRLQRLGSN